MPSDSNIEYIVQSHIDKIKECSVPNLENAILQHYTQVSALYKNNPPLYKTIFKSFRFYLISFITVEYYMKDESTFSDVYSNFLPLKYMSKNSVSSFFSFLVVTGRLNISLFSKDKRKVAYKLTPKIKGEAFLLIKTMTTPLINLLDIKSKNSNDIDLFLTDFLRNFSRLVYTNSFNFDSIPNASLFINKDAGHSILLNLYCNRTQHTSTTFKTLTVKQLSTICGVSRSHIKKILANAGQCDLICNPNTEGNIIINQNFVNLTQNYMIRYFAFCLIGLDFK